MTGCSEPRPQPHRRRPDRRCRGVRARPPRTRPAGRRRRQPRCRRPREQVRRLHRHPDTDGRLLCHRLRRPRNGPSVQRQPPVQREPAELLGRKPECRHLDRGRLRLVDHGLRGHLRDRRSLSAQRPVLLPAVAPGDLDLHVVEPGGDQRGPVGRPAPLRRRATKSRSRRSGRASSRRTRSSRSRSRSARPRTDDAARRALAESGTTVTVSTGAAGGTHTLQPGDSITISGAGDPGYNGTFTVDTVLTTRAFTLTNPIPGLTEVRRRDDHAERARPHRGRQHRDRPDDARPQPLGRRPGHDRRRRTTPATTSRRRSRSPRSRLRGASSSRTPSRACRTRAPAR